MRSLKSCLILISCVAMLSVGCARQKERTLLDTIPATSTVVAHVNADKLLKMAGCDSRNGSITLSDDIISLLSCSEHALSLVKTASAMGSSIDLTNLYAICYDSTWTLTAPRLESVVLTPIGQNVKTKHLGKIKVSTTDSISILYNDIQVWLEYGSKESIVDDIELLISGADAAPMSKYAYVADYLAKAEMARAYAAMPLVQNPVGSDFNAVLVSADGYDRNIRISAQMLRNGFKINPTEKLCIPDGMVLQSMPSATIASLAMGLGPGILPELMPWARQLPLASQLLVNAISALADLDGGTFAIGIAPGGSAETIKTLTLDRWMFKALLPIADKGQDVADFINQVTNDNFYCQADSAYLSVTNYDPEYYPSDDAIRLIPGAVMQATLSIGYRSQVMKAFGLKSGYKIETWASDSTLYAQINLQGPGQYLMPTMLRDLNNCLSSPSWKK